MTRPPNIRKLHNSSSLCRSDSFYLHALFITASAATRLAQGRGYCYGSHASSGHPSCPNINLTAPRSSLSPSLSVSLINSSSSSSCYLSFIRHPNKFSTLFFLKVYLLFVFIISLVDCNFQWVLATWLPHLDIYHAFIQHV
jgi:hypothetical protein